MEKIKRFIKSNQGKDILILLIIILVGIISFMLGQMSISRANGINIEYSSLTGQVVSSVAKTGQVSDFLAKNPKLNREALTTEKAFFASKNGKKYYPVDCSAGKSIKIENRIYFKNNSEAESAGYSMSASCR